MLRAGFGFDPLADPIDQKTLGRDPCWNRDLKVRKGQGWKENSSSSRRRAVEKAAAERKSRRKDRVEE